MSLQKLAVCLIAFPAFAAHAQSEQVAETAVALPDEQMTPVATPIQIKPLPAGTPIIVSLDSEITTQNNLLGDGFTVTVVNDVIQDDVVVIPKGTKGRGEVTFLTKKGGFGKPGIIGIALRDLELNGRQVLLDGRFREEGGNNNAAASATMFAAGIAAVFVKGKTSVIPAGRELKGRTGEDIMIPLNSPATILPQVDNKTDNLETITAESQTPSN